MTSPYDTTSKKADVTYLFLEDSLADKRIEHVDSTTIVEVAITEEDRAEFMRVYRENCNG